MVMQILVKHAKRAGVELLGIGNAGNHLHLRVKIPGRKPYLNFIRAVTGEIALKIKKITNAAVARGRHFWDHRPFSSIVAGRDYANRITDYLKINELEGQGFVRAFARLVVQRQNKGDWPEFIGGVFIVPG